ncbi:hypothetical protein LINPERHAP2_LOCUS17556 [Linum perenne]
MQYLQLISKYAACDSLEDDNEEPIPRPLPYGREVYRSGFLLNTTTTTNVNCLNMLRMKRRIFWNLVTLLKTEGGLTRTRNMEVDEMLAMFLVTIGHNIKNRTCQLLFHRSGETVCRTIRRVLVAILKLHNLLIAQPVPVPNDCMDERWKVFPVTTSEPTREYKVWSKLEEKTLVMCMVELTDQRIVEKGNFRITGLKQLERMLHDRVEQCQLLAIPHIKSKVRYFKDKFTATLELKEASGFGWDDARGCIVADEAVYADWVKSHPKASGLNNKPLPYFDELCKVFGVDHAIGADAVQAADAASILEPNAMDSDFMSDYNMSNADSYNFHEEIMEEIRNAGIDLQATGLKEVEAAASSKRRVGKGKERATSSGTKRSRNQLLEDERAMMAESIASATENIARIATNYCIEGDLAVKRQSLYYELNKLTSLTVMERTKALRHLNRDDGDAATYFQFPTDEERLDFVRSFLG